MSPFRDVEVELVNHFSDDRGRTFASSFEEFVTKIVYAINEALTDTVEGRELLYAALDNAASKNMTPEEWRKEYANILIVIMKFLILDNCRPLKDEFSRHVYDMLRREN